MKKAGLILGLALVALARPAMADAGPGQIVSETPTEIVYNGWNAEYCEGLPDQRKAAQSRGNVL